MSRPRDDVVIRPTIKQPGVTEVQREGVRARQLRRDRERGGLIQRLARGRIANQMRVALGRSALAQRAAQASTVAGRVVASGATRAAGGAAARVGAAAGGATLAVGAIVAGLIAIGVRKYTGKNIENLNKDFWHALYGDRALKAQAANAVREQMASNPYMVSMLGQNNAVSQDTYKIFDDLLNIQEKLIIGQDLVDRELPAYNMIDVGAEAIESLVSGFFNGWDTSGIDRKVQEFDGVMRGDFDQDEYMMSPVRRF